jgi:hypothetical protein
VRALLDPAGSCWFDHQLWLGLFLVVSAAQVAFDLLEDMRASGLTPSTPTCSSLIYACLQNNNFAAARKVSLCQRQA